MYFCICVNRVFVFCICVNCVFVFCIYESMPLVERCRGVLLSGRMTNQIRTFYRGDSVKRNQTNETRTQQLSNLSTSVVLVVLALLVLVKVVL